MVDGSPGAEVFTIFPDLFCSVCDGQFHCQDIKEFTTHVLQCLTRKGVRKETARLDLTLYKTYGVVPKAVKVIIEDARSKRDLDAVCIAPVRDHPNIKGFADLQRKERKISDMTNEMYEETKGPNGPVIKLAKGVDMPLDRMVWIQTPLYSELATLLLAGMQPIRHSPRGIHLPVFMRETGMTKVIHLHVDRFEELAAVGMAEQNWEMMKIELQQVGVQSDGDADNGRIPDVTTGDPTDAIKKMIGRNHNGKRQNGKSPEKKVSQKLFDDGDTETKRAKIDDRYMAENVGAMTVKPRSNGECMSTRRFDDPINERPGCSKYI